MHATRYPRANTTAQWFADTHAGETWGYLEKCVWHSTESPGWPAYGGGSMAPTFTARPDFTTRTVHWRQHFPVNMSSRAMRNLAGGVQTNRDRAVQVELVGTCDARPRRDAVAADWTRRGMRAGTDFMVTSDPPAWVVEQCADFAAWLNREWDVPLVTVPRWLPFDESYGNSPARLSGPAWDAFRGHLGHQHAAENSHGDPGAWPMHTVLAAARRIVSPPPPDKELPVTPAEIEAVAKRAAELVLAQLPQATARAVLATDLGSSGPTTGVALQTAYQTLVRTSPDAIAQAVAAKLPVAAAGGLTAEQLQGAVRAAVVDVLRAGTG